MIEEMIAETMDQVNNDDEVENQVEVDNIINQMENGLLKGKNNIDLQPHQ